MHISLAPQASLANQALQVRPEGCECARTKNVNFSLPVWSDFICFTFWLIYYICICAKFKKKKLYGCYGQPLPIVWHHPLWIHVFLGMQAVFVLYVLNFSLSLGCLTCFTCHFLYFNPVLKHPLFHFRNIYCFSSLSVVEVKMCFQFVGVCANSFIFPCLICKDSSVGFMSYSRFKGIWKENYNSTFFARL